MNGTLPGGNKNMADIMKSTRHQISDMKKAVELLGRASGDPLWASLQGGPMGTMGPALKNIKQTLDKAEGAAFRFASLSSDANEFFGGKK